MDWLTGLFTSEYQGKNLQRNGPISKDIILQFFAKGRELFDDPSFKSQLKAAAQRRMDVPGLITELQKSVFEGLGIQGDYGIRYLSCVRQHFSSDANFLTIFYDFVGREEMAADEAELEPEQFQAKYSVQIRMREEIEKSQEVLQSMTTQEQQAFMHELTMRLTQEQGMQQPAAPAQGISVMSSEQQMKFFQNLKEGPGTS